MEDKKRSDLIPVVFYVDVPRESEGLGTCVRDSIDRDAFSGAADSAQAARNSAAGLQNGSGEEKWDSNLPTTTSTCWTWTVTELKKRNGK